MPKREKRSEQDASRNGTAKRGITTVGSVVRNVKTDIAVDGSVRENVGNTDNFFLLFR